MKTTSAILLATLAFLLCEPAFPQAGQLRALAVRYQEDLERLQGYEWTSRTEVTVEDETREILLARVRRDAGGKTERTPIRDETRKHKKAAEFVEDLEELIGSYTRFTPEEMYTVFAGAKVFPEHRDGQDLLRFQVRDVVHPGDSMYMWADSFDYRLRVLEIRTSLDGQPVHVATEFRDLEDGPTCATRTTVNTELKKKPTLITIERFDHERRGE